MKTNRLVVLALVAACNPPIDGTPLDRQPVQPISQQAPSGPTYCPATTPHIDPKILPGCAPACAGAHCVPSDRIPSSESWQLATCPTGVCVPDKLIRSGGAAPPSCSSLGGNDGVCMSLCVPQVARFRDLLPQDVCDDDERCAPCIDPLTGSSSGACEIGVACMGPPPPVMCPYKGPPIILVDQLPSCYKGGGAHCIDNSLVTPDQAALLGPCPMGAGLCTPDDFIVTGGQLIPKKCHALDDAEGRCLHLVIPQIAKEASMLPVDVCQPYERCAPCYDPRDGKKTPACTESCDPGPTQPPVVFADCCKKGVGGAPLAKCVPKTAVPMSFQSDLGPDTCKAGTELCVPTENLDPDFKPKKCKGSSLLLGSYDGVCLSICLQLGLQQAAISPGDCDSLHQCIPCMALGSPTGAPGC